MIALLLAILMALALFRRLPVLARFRELALWGGRSAALLRRGGVSEWAKERAMRLHALRLFAASARAGLMLAVVAAPIAVVLAIDAGLDLGVREALLDWRQRLGILSLCGGYALVRWHVRRRLQPR